MKISLTEQAEAADRELTARRNMYPTRVQVGTMTQADAEHEIALMRAIRDTLALFAKYEDAVRDTLAAEIKKQKAARDADDLNHPAVTSLLKEFPDAEFVGSRDIPTDEPLL